jgi:ketosteroid isomerase-like protein
MSTLEDKQALTDLMARYIDAVNRRSGEDWAATWAENGTWNLLGNEVTGRENILGMWQQMMAGFEFALMMPSSSLFKLEGDKASGHWYLQEFTRDQDGNAAAVLSRYRDTYSRVNGQWLYQSRHYDIIYYGPPDLSGAYTAPA